MNLFPPRAWNDGAVEIEEMGGLGDILRARTIFTARVVGYLAGFRDGETKFGEDPEVHETFRARLGELGFEPEDLGAEAFGRFLATEHGRYVALIRDARIEAQ